jgi:hypothetical protein
LLETLRTVVEQNEGSLRLIALLLTLVAGTGGLMYWVDRWRNRIRFYVRLLEIDDTFFSFEVENVGREPTSLAHQVGLIGYRRDGSRKADRVEETYSVIAEDRSLPPSAPKRFSAFRSQSDYGMSAEELSFDLPRYRILCTRGRPKTIYGVRHSRRHSIESRGTDRHGAIPHLSAVEYWRKVVQYRFRSRKDGASAGTSSNHVAGPAAAARRRSAQ